MNLLKEDRVNYLNIGLMLITAVLAYYFPFETFLLAYAYLGPLHYLTEISWLHDRQYFAKGKWDYLVLLVIGILLSLDAMFNDLKMSNDFVSFFNETNLSNQLLIIAIFSGIVFALIKNFYFKLGLIGLFYLIIVRRWLHPSNDIQVIYGQGTSCFELLQQETNFDYIVCPVGGGGLIAGTCLFANQFSPKTQIIGAEPFEVDDAYRSLISKKIEMNTTTNTIADGLRTNLGSNNFPIILHHVTKIIRVTEKEIIAAMKFVWERMKIIIEPSSAVAVAVVLKDKKLFKNKKVAVIISGGNVDLENLPF